MPGISSAQGKKGLQQDVNGSKMLAMPVRLPSDYEFFVAGIDYQVRSFINEFSGDEKVRTFPDAPLTPTSLGKDYAGIRIYSRCVGRTPGAQIWPGQSGPDDQPYAMNSSKDVAATQMLPFPPFTVAMHAPIDMRHPIDRFLSAPDDRYNVVDEEEKDGRKLTIVDVSVPAGLMSGSLDENGQPQQVPTCYWYRAWLDMERGGIPTTMKFWYGTEGKPFDERLRSQPTRIMKTTKIARVEDEAWYPIESEEEELDVDPAAPSLTDDQWKEVRAGTRKSPDYVVFERLTWACSNINTKDPGSKEFFVLHFPKGQRFFDLDAKKVIGAPERKPFVKVGQPAPAWRMARWMDGKEHSLKDFRDKVVVLDFWGLWCSACRNNVPVLVALQEKYKDKPVVFVSVHTAEGDPGALAERINEYADKKRWHPLTAIDAGTSIDNSSTTHDYGCQGFPSQLVIGFDGLVKYNSDEPPKGMEDAMGKSCDEVTPDDEAKMNAYMAEQFKAAGERWPLPDGTSDENTMAAMNRVAVFMMSQQIEAALAERK